MEPFFFSTLIVALAEMGDKTQLLAFVLATRFKRPGTIILGILAATLLNHALAGVTGQLLAHWLSPEILRWMLGLGFIGMALWVMIPDKLDDDVSVRSNLGVFSATVVAFFLAEMGDKTQLATVALAAQYQALGWVVLGTTLGMMLANIPAVIAGDRLTRTLNLRWVHAGAAGLFLLLGLWALAPVLST